MGMDGSTVVDERADPVPHRELTEAIAVQNAYHEQVVGVRPVVNLRRAA
jgi:hypothetical protein